MWYERAAPIAGGDGGTKGVGMNDSKWARYAAIGGVAFVVLNIVGAILSGSPPSGNDSATKIANYYVDKGDGLKAALWLGGIASVGLVWWFGSLWRRMSRAEGGAHRLSVVSLLGLGLGGALFLASAAVNAAIALRASDVGEGARVFYTLSLVLLAGSGFGLAIHLLATNALALRSKMLPTWLGWLGLVAGLAFLLAGVLGSATDNASGLMAGFVGFIGFSVWVLGVSAVLWRDTPESAS
jgi:hypothetical protein